MSKDTLSASAIMGITDDHLVEVNERSRDSHRLIPQAKDAFLKMQEKANHDNVDIQICSSFRSFDKQLSIWNRKWQGELALNTLEGKQLDAKSLDDEEKIHAIMLWSALPGASRHHWGTDFDVFDKAEVERRHHAFDLVPQEYESDGPCANLSLWLAEHSKDFGFYLPYAKYVGGVAREPWHLSYRPVSETIEKNIRIEDLKKQLRISDILGKHAVLERLSELVERYTFNKGL